MERGIFLSDSVEILRELGIEPKENLDEDIFLLFDAETKELEVDSIKGCQVDRTKRPIKPLPRVRCKRCNSEFFLKKGSKRTLCKACELEVWKSKPHLIPKVCPLCGRNFKTYHEEHEICYYCFLRAKARKEFEPRTCPWCSKVFKPSHGLMRFCSIRCKDNYHYRKRRGLIS